MTKVDFVIGCKLFSCLFLAVTSKLINLQEVELIDLRISARQSATAGEGRRVLDPGARRT